MSIVPLAMPAPRKRRQQLRADLATSGRTGAAPEGKYRGIVRGLPGTPIAASEVPPLFESVPSLIQRGIGTSQPQPLIDGVLPPGLTMLHAQPREWKSLCALEMAIALASGRPAFGQQIVTAPGPVLYLTEEDPLPHVVRRIASLLHGDPAPADLHVSAGNGINLDDEDCQVRLIAAAQAHGCRLMVLDPLRSLTDGADQGPRELRPVALFLRRLMREAECSVLVVHHDTKPSANGNGDRRRRPQRASGGGIFSIADNPIAIEQIDEHRRVLVPCAFKFSADPKPLQIRLDAGDGWLRLVAEDAVSADVENVSVDTKIVEYLLHSPGSNGSSVAKGIRAQKSVVLERLKALQKAGTVDSTTQGRAVRWTAKTES